MVTDTNTATATDTNTMEIRPNTSILHSTTPTETPSSSQAIIPGLEELNLEAQQPRIESTSGSEDSDMDSIAFVPEACLFCPQLSSNFQNNLTHMQKSHGLFIPASIDDGALSLAVDTETLISYMHLVVFGYHECLFCGTQRANAWAARQHMMGRGHCRIDLSSIESEWRDFYEFEDKLLSDNEDEDLFEDKAEESSFDGEQCAAHVRTDAQILPIVDGNSLRLSSGKVISHRTAPAPKDPLRKPMLAKESRRGDDHLLLEDLIPTAQQPDTCTSSDSNTATSSLNPEETPHQHSRTLSLQSPQTQSLLSRADRRLLGANKSAVTAAVATMSKRDRAALAHLSPAERQAMVVSQFKHQDRLHIAKRKYWSKFERRQDIPAEGGKVYIGGG